MERAPHACTPCLPHTLTHTHTHARSHAHTHIPLVSQDLTPVDIPELDERRIRRKTARDSETRKYAAELLEAKGRRRLWPHPFLRRHKWRLCLTDRLHQLLGKKSHKRLECQQHLACIVRTLTHDRSNIMESLKRSTSDDLLPVPDPLPCPSHHNFQHRPCVHSQAIENNLHGKPIACNSFLPQDDVLGKQKDYQASRGRLGKGLSEGAASLRGSPL